MLMLFSEAENERVDSAMGKPATHLAQSETPCGEVLCTEAGRSRRSLKYFDVCQNNSSEPHT